MMSKYTHILYEYIFEEIFFFSFEFIFSEWSPPTSYDDALEERPVHTLSVFAFAVCANAL
jgi:hypothetical protein